MSITSSPEVRRSFRRCVNSIWRASLRSERTRITEQPRSLRGIGSRSRILGTHRLKGAMSYLTPCTKSQLGTAEAPTTHCLSSPSPLFSGVMPSISRSEFARLIKHRLDTQARGGIIPISPRLMSHRALWDYAGLERPQSDILHRFFFVIRIDDQSVKASLAQVDRIELSNHHFNVTCSD